MRVLNVVSVVSAREGGGNAERTVQLTRALVESGIVCTVMTLDIGEPHAREASMGGARMVVVPCINRRFQVPWPAWLQIRNLVAQADVIHLMGYWSLLGAMVQVAARKAGVPYVVCPAGALPLFGRSQLVKRLFNSICGEQLIRGASGWIAITRAEIPDFEAYGVPPDRVSVIPNGVVESDFELGPACSPDGRQDDPAGQRILFMGRLNPIKGPDLLLEAFGRVALQFPSARLIYAGPDEGMKLALEQRATALGIDDRVQFVGFIGGPAKVAAYRTASLLVVPSRLEAMSIVAVEGGVCGTPVLMTDQCGLTDLAEIDPSLIVPASVEGLTEGLRFALESSEHLSELGLRWQSMVLQRFLWRDIGRNFRMLLEQVARQGGM
jgi:glycosyltransferase involved in cell wall biosynthesis